MSAANQSVGKNGLAITSVRYRGTEAACLACPVVVRDKVPLVVECRLRLVMDDLHDLINRALDYGGLAR
jgi:hypothetical protein